MPGCSTGSWMSGPTKAPAIDTWGLPVLQRIREEFSRQYDSLESISCEELARHWQRLAEDEQLRGGRGRLRPQEHQAIALRVSQALKEMDLQCTGRVSKEEWVHYMLLTQSDTPRVAAQINSVLKAVLQHHQGILGDLQQMFEIADTANTGWLSYDEVVEVYKREQWRLWVSETGALTCDAETSGKAPENLANDIMKAMDLDDDGQISYTDFMAFCLGRRRQVVALNLYDLSNGSMPSVSPWLLGERIEGIWHCGMVVFDKEYYFGGELVYDTPGQTCFGTPVKTIPLGVTLWRRDELHAYIVNDMKPLFSRDTYDVIYNNCNHFADRVCQWLTGKGIPKEVGNQAEALMQYTATKALVPLLNRWLGNKYLEAKAVEKRPANHGFSMRSNSARSELNNTPREQMQKGMIVGIKPANGNGPAVLGTISGPDIPSSSSSSSPSSRHPLGKSKSLPSLDLSRTRDAPASTDGTCWVTYFGAPTLSARGSRGKVCTELLSQDRILPVVLDDVGSEGVYYNALRAMTKEFVDPAESGDPSQNRCRGSASYGLSPMTALVPGSMRDDVQLESPRFTTTHDSAKEKLAALGFSAESVSKALALTNDNFEKAKLLLATSPGSVAGASSPRTPRSPVTSAKIDDSKLISRMSL